MSRSVTQDIIGVTDIGLRSEEPMGGVFFGTGVTRALSQLEGGVPFLTTVLIRCVITGASSTAQCLKTQYGTPSTPGEVFFNAANILYASYSQVKYPYSASLYQKGRFYCGDLLWVIVRVCCDTSKMFTDFVEVSESVIHLAKATSLPRFTK